LGILYNLRKKQENLLNFADQTNTLKVYDIFVQNVSQQDLIKKAYISMDKLLQINDDSIWLETNSLEKYKSYPSYDEITADILKKYKDTSKTFPSFYENMQNHKKSAKDSIAKNEEKLLLDEKAWKKTESLNTFEGYLNFIQNNRNEYTIKKRSEVLSRLQDSVLNLGKVGWVFGGRLDQNKNIDTTGTGNKYFKYVWRINEDKSMKLIDIPEDGDILESKFQRSTIYESFYTYNRKGLEKDKWSINDKAYVLDVVADGDYFIVKILYKNKDE
jgi:hypothetical protein